MKPPGTLNPAPAVLPSRSPMRGWLEGRWAELCVAIASAPPGWAAWARRELGGEAVGAALAAQLGWDSERPVPRGGLDQARDARTRTSLGQVFTPPGLARLVARLAGCGVEEGSWPHATALDPACGAGSLLVAAAEARRAAGWSTAEALATLEGWDRDPVAAWSCRATLVAWALAGAEGPEPGPLRVVSGLDALSDQASARVAQGVGAVLSNPPYLEAKRMGRAAPGLRERLRARFPQLEGAFDLYLAFCWAALEWVAPGGRAVLLLPNKVLQGRYAARFREQVLSADAPTLTHLADLSRLSPRPFPGTGVYPIVIRLDRRPETPGEGFAGLRMHAHDELDTPLARWGRTSLAGPRRVGGDHPLFVPFDTWPALAPLLDDRPRLGDIARVASTCSFHAKGLRERFVVAERPDALGHPYLGGLSRARRTEIAPFRLRWEGWWIRFDQEALRREHRNPLPDLQRTFLRPKAIFCQHAPRMRVWADFEGRWVTKDVYPVAWPTDGAYTLGRLAAVLQSTVFTALYNTLYQGIVVGGETYHYLPAFLSRVPVPPGDHPALAGCDELVAALQAAGPEAPVDGAAWDALDRRVAAAYGVSEADRQRMIEVHLRRVGAEHPG